MQIDQLSAMLQGFNVHAGVFYNGSLCGIASFGEDGKPDGHLHLLRSGRMRIHLSDGKIMPVQGPSLICFPRGVKHRFFVADGEAVELTCASLQFQGGAHNPIAQAMPEVVAIHIDELVQAGPLLAWLFSEAQASGEGRMAILDRLFELLIIQILRHLIAHQKIEGGLLAGLSDPRLARALGAVHAHPAADWTIESMATTAGMSRARFADHFRATVGATPLDYLTRWRIMLAQQQLLAGQPMKLIAGQVGYESPSALARAFRRKMDYTPAEWLSRQRN
ncbi:MAG: AraC family transcriptional regulator [Janthinobacterium sp.]|jgi:AraC-like DNA-binding protein|uniref:AraC family transcriptional regulator n=1 Tax=Burkholderiales TaxID=80840 RepID=UPI000D4CBC62|nr:MULTISPECIES: AraC family transcriptional regulator [Burkholderiales]PRZ43219.1 AraC family transcriptional regulator [Paraburkholderia fungorum]